MDEILKKLKKKTEKLETVIGGCNKLMPVQIGSLLYIDDIILFANSYGKKLHRYGVNNYKYMVWR